MTRYRPIADYGIVGDLHSAALIDRMGSIDWFCIPRFDSPSVFGRLIDADRGGSLSLDLARAVPHDRSYLGNTNVLQTRIRTASGIVQVTDFMVAREELRHPDDDHILVRRLQADEPVQLIVRVNPAFNYARDRHEVRLDGCCVHLVARQQVIHLDGPGDWERAGDDVILRIALEPGQPADLVLRYAEEGVSHRRQDADALLRATLSYWEHWSSRCTYRGRYPSAVMRSALTLKLLIYAPEGSIVAAPTTSLPEWIGGDRNWDYRYTWLRDSSFLLYALHVLGYYQEARDFIAWLTRVHLRDPRDFQILYRVDGNPSVVEEELSHLEGYRGSRPVRIGNAAADQLQLDVYGEIIDAAYLHRRYGGGSIDPDLCRVICHMLDFVCKHWQEPDNGIWEVRGPRRHFLYSKLLSWVALDRGIRLADELGLKGDLDHWTHHRDEIRRAIETQGYSQRLGAFTQALGEERLDASALMIPLVKFLPPSDPRVISTVDRIERALSRDGLVYRYPADTDDGLRSPEGAFTICPFWLVNNLALQGRLSDARTLFEHLCQFGNDLGLFSEEVDPRDGSALGNFPQAFTHLALVIAAAHIDRVERRMQAGEPPSKPGNALRSPAA